MDTQSTLHEVVAELRQLRDTQQQLLNQLRMVQGNVGCITLLLLAAAVYYWFWLR
jgi:hypothetical protein